MLLEVLITVSVAAVVLVLGGRLIYASLESNQSSTNENSALGLAQEEMAGVIGAATQQWQNIYNLTGGTSTYYYATTTSGSWTIAAGTELKALNNANLVRYFTVQGVCRATSTNNITGVSDSGGASTTTCATSGGNIDPSTELVTVTVSSTSTSPVSLPEFVTRWRNEVCVQGSWSTINSSTSSCSTPTTYQGESNVSADSGLKLCIGGC